MVPGSDRVHPSSPTGGVTLIEDAVELQIALGIDLDGDRDGFADVLVGATGVIALFAEPARRHVRTSVDRLVWGQRDDPLEVAYLNWGWRVGTSQRRLKLRYQFALTDRVVHNIDRAVQEVLDPIEIHLPTCLLNPL